MAKADWIGDSGGSGGSGGAESTIWFSNAF